MARSEMLGGGDPFAEPALWFEDIVVLAQAVTGDGSVT